MKKLVVLAACAALCLSASPAMAEEEASLDALQGTYTALFPEFAKNE